MTDLAPQQAERQAICDLMIELGPEAPTLCAGWTTYDLAGHLYVREHKPLAGLGIVFPPAAGIHAGGIVKAKATFPYEQLVDKVRNGPPVMWKFVDGPFNTQEYFIHHEDVRRGGGDNTPRDPHFISAINASMWKALQRTHKFATRGIKGVRVDIVAGTGETLHSGKGDEVVSIIGDPGELVLYLAGRREAAQVQIEGSDTAKAKLSEAKLGI